MSSVHRSGTESRASTAIDRSDSPAKDQSWRNPDYLATPNVAESGPLGQVSCAASARSPVEPYKPSSGSGIGHAGPQAVDRAASVSASRSRTARGIADATWDISL